MREWLVALFVGDKTPPSRDLRTLTDGEIEQVSGGWLMPIFPVTNEPAKTITTSAKIPDGRFR
jgi:hypothetical protein